ncbi:hypothetical protein GOP47_0016145 [Adiantum capillus-veneris]|uniref:Uncharacterized protein n=1 Tax=Adiantum capillus-veneris TaxID=13818 RepID=A0A9D4UL04_ADICA|nr:hypothetical protein GOP47_0016145 [Adiantum capillus-veneris]
MPYHKFGPLACSRRHATDRELLQFFTIIHERKPVLDEIKCTLGACIIDKTHVHDYINNSTTIIALQSVVYCVWLPCTWSLKVIALLDTCTKEIVCAHAFDMITELMEGVSLALVCVGLQCTRQVHDNE